MSDSKTTPRQTLHLNDTLYETTFTKKYAQRKPFVPKDPKHLMALIPGLVLETLVKPGDRVRKGQSLLILEAMKMQNHIASPQEGTVQSLHVSPGETIPRGQLLVTFE